MKKTRLEAFSDGVFAIIITIMVIELTPPHESDLAALKPLVPKFLSYVMSFVLLGIYWNNHHHLWQAVEKVNGSILWANTHLLFWLSLIPFVTGWMGENQFATLPVASYGVVMWMSGLAYFLMTRTLIANHHMTSVLAAALGNNAKEYISLILYTLAIPLAFLSSAISVAIYVIVSVMWLIPDSRFEGRFGKE